MTLLGVSKVINSQETHTHTHTHTYIHTYIHTCVCVKERERTKSGMPDGKTIQPVASTFLLTFSVFLWKMSNFSCSWALHFLKLGNEIKNQTYCKRTAAGLFFLIFFDSLFSVSPFLICRSDFICNQSPIWKVKRTVSFLRVSYNKKTVHLIFLMSSTGENPFQTVTAKKK